MKTVTWSADTPWAEVLRQVGQEEILVMRNGHAVALFSPFDDEDLHGYARERDPAFLASIARARQQVQEGNTVNHGDLKQALGID